jgi:hypothetical protein
MARGILKIVDDDSQLGQRTSRRLSLLCLAVAAGMSLLTYTHEGRFWDSEVTFRPGLLSGIAALALVAPLYARRILTWNRSAYSIVSFLLVLAFFASLVQMALGGNSKSAFIMPLLAVAVAMSWLGLREVAGASWLVVLIAGAWAAVITDLALGYAGFVYLACGVVGLSLHAGLNPGQLILGALQEYKGESRGDVSRIANETNQQGARQLDALHLPNDRS